MMIHIQSALNATRGRVEGPYGAAKLLGINPHTLRQNAKAESRLGQIPRTSDQLKAFTN